MLGEGVVGRLGCCCSGEDDDDGDEDEEAPSGGVRFGKEADEAAGGPVAKGGEVTLRFGSINDPPKTGFDTVTGLSTLLNDILVRVRGRFHSGDPPGNEDDGPEEVELVDEPDEDDDDENDDGDDVLRVDEEKEIEARGEGAAVVPTGNSGDCNVGDAEDDDDEGDDELSSCDPERDLNEYTRL